MKYIDEEIQKYVEVINSSQKSFFKEDVKEEEILKQMVIINETMKKIQLNSKDTYENIIDSLKLKLRIQEKREKKIILSLINILDNLEWLFNNALIFSNEGMMKTIKITKKLIQKELASNKIIATPDIGDLYNEDYHICVGYKVDNTLMDNQIIDVIKKGYIFRDKVIRQAEVIVINNSMGE